MECKAVTAALNSPLGCEHPEEMLGLEQNKIENGGCENEQNIVGNI